MILIVKRTIKALLIAIRRYHAYKDNSPDIGSKNWLIQTEIKYGGYTGVVRRRKSSPQDDRTKEQLAAGGMVGGDRMIDHGYASIYSEYLQPYIGKQLTLVEIGILKGTGLAIWCDLFPQARVIGLDIDTSHARENMPMLQAQGAFTKNKPELYEFDQFVDNRELLRDILGDSLIDVCIDDGNHSKRSILSTLASVTPNLNANFVYFVEDNKQVHADIAAEYPEAKVKSIGAMTIISK